MEKLLLTIPEAADRLGIGRSKLYELVAEGELGVVRIGRAVRVEAAEIVDFVTRLRQERATGDGES
jgi:excisionase family DNA binding protein